MGNVQENWSITPATNGSADANVAMADGTLFGADHGAGRNIMARVAAFVKSLNGSITSGGSANAQTFTSPSGHAFTALAAGMLLKFKAGYTNSGAATLAVDGLTAKAITKGLGAPLAANDIVAGNIYEVAYDATRGQFQLLGAVGGASISGALFGLTLSNNGSDATNDIDIAAGSAADATGAVMMTLASALTKQLDAAWAAGTNQGGLDTGSIADGWYYAWLIMRSDTGVVDVLLSASSSAPTMPANYDFKRYLGPFKRVSSAIAAFFQRGDNFWWTTPGAFDFNVNNPGTSVNSRAINVPPKQVTAIVYCEIQDSTPAAPTFGSFRSPSGSDPSLSGSGPYDLSTTAAGAGVPVSAGQVKLIETSTSAIQVKVNNSTADHYTLGGALGWIDTRGRLS